MKYGHIAGNTRINAAIYRCFRYLAEKDAQAFVRKFRDQLDDEQQVMHTFRELILGGFLGSNELRVRHEHSVDGKTPDWSIFGPDSDLRGIVELLNFHTDKATEDDIERHRKAGALWSGWMGSNVARLYTRIQDKVTVYKELVERSSVPYVVSLFSEFTANVDLDEVRECVLSREIGLFSLYPMISGLLFFEEQSGTYHFTYLQNPDAAREISLPSGLF